jgi:hypothetical protein
MNKNRVDISALRKAAQGDPKQKVTVTKAWLKVVADELADLQKRRQADQLTERQIDEMDKGMDETFGHMDRAFDSMDKMFGKLFGGKGSNGFISRKIRIQRSKT